MLYFVLFVSNVIMSHDSLQIVQMSNHFNVINEFVNRINTDLMIFFDQFHPPESF